MELMNGVVYYAQCAILALSSLFIFISYGAGVWWNKNHLNYDMSFTLWKLCSKYTTYENCISIKEDYLQSGMKLFYSN